MAPVCFSTVWSAATRVLGTIKGSEAQSAAAFVGWKGHLSDKLETTLLGVSVAGIAVLMVKDLITAMRWEESWVGAYWTSVWNAQGEVNSIRPTQR